MERLNPIVWQRLEGIVFCISAVIAFYYTGISWWLFIVLLLAFDVSMVGYLRNPKLGALVYNIGHSLILPLVLFTLGTVQDSPLTQAIAAVWVAHIGLDRAFGYGLKYNDAFTHTHIGIIGKNKR